MVARDTKPASRVTAGQVPGCGLTHPCWWLRFHSFSSFLKLCIKSWKAAIFWDLAIIKQSNLVSGPQAKRMQALHGRRHCPLPAAGPSDFVPQPGLPASLWLQLCRCCPHPPPHLLCPQGPGSLRPRVPATWGMGRGTLASEHWRAGMPRVSWVSFSYSFEQWLKTIASRLFSIPQSILTTANNTDCLPFTNC